MAVFKRVNDQYTAQINAYSTTAKLYVGDVVSYDVATKEAVKLNDLNAVKTAFDSGLLVGIIAQSDAVTEKTGPVTKTYTIDTLVDMTNNASSGSEKIIVVYVVKDINNIQF